MNVVTDARSLRCTRSVFARYRRRQQLRHAMAPQQAKQQHNARNARDPLVLTGYGFRLQRAHSRPRSAPGVTDLANMACRTQDMCMWKNCVHAYTVTKTQGTHAPKLAHHNWTKCLRRTRTTNPGRSQKPPAAPERAAATLLAPCVFWQRSAPRPLHI